jgi:hypothetical protein
MISGCHYSGLSRLPTSGIVQGLDGRCVADACALLVNRVHAELAARELEALHLLESHLSILLLLVPARGPVISAQRAMAATGATHWMKQ